MSNRRIHQSGLTDRRFQRQNPSIKPTPRSPILYKETNENPIEQGSLSAGSAETGAGRARNEEEKKIAIFAGEINRSRERGSRRRCCMDTSEGGREGGEGAMGNTCRVGGEEPGLGGIGDDGGGVGGEPRGVDA